MDNILIKGIIAQIVGVLAIIFFALSPQQKNKKRILIFQLISSILYALQYMFLGAFSAVATNLIGAVKNLSFYMYTKKDKDIPIAMLYIYIIIIVVFGVLTFSNILSVLPIILSVIFTYGTWQSNLKIYRIIALVTSVIWLIYNLGVGAYVSGIGNIFQITSAIIAIVRLDIIKKNVQA